MLVTVHADLPVERVAGHTVQYAVLGLDDRARVSDVSSGVSAVPSDSAGVTVVAVLRLRPGLSTIKAALRTDDGLEGSIFTEIEIPNRYRHLTMSDVELTSPTVRWTVLGNPPRFITSSLPGPPATRRAFAGDDVLTIYGEVYFSTDESPQVALTVRRADGPKGRQLELPLTLATGGRVHRASYRATLAVRDLPPGVHVLEVSARDQHGRTVRKLLDLNITDASRR